MYPLDIRQSDEWAQYLEFLGWVPLKTSLGANAAMMTSKFGNVIKVQRPVRLVEGDLNELEAIAVENKVALVKIEPSLSQDLQVLTAKGYESNGSPLSPPTTIFINLGKTAEELWEDLSGSCKYSIKRAQREGVKVKFFDNPNNDLVQQFYEIHSSTGRQKKFYIQGYDDVQKKVDLYGDKAILGLSYSADGAITGGNLYLGFGEGVWYMHGGTTVDGRKTKNGYELYWQSILYLKSKGYAWFDLEGVDDKRYPAFTKNWGGLSHFKERFGGVRVEFPRTYVKIYKPLLKKLSRYFSFQI